MVRTFAMPTARSFALSGQARLANAATDDVLDRALGLPDAAHGGVTATSGRRLTGGFANRASAAIDHDSTTWYSPGFLGQQGEYVDARIPKAITFDHFDLTVLNDGRHSVPRVVRLIVDGKTSNALRFRLPDIADGSTPDSRHTFPIRLAAPVTGSDIKLEIEPDARSASSTVREVRTLDWITGQGVDMPVGIVDLGIPGLRAPAPARRADPTCRTDLVTIDGKAVAVSLRGTTADLLAGKPIAVVACAGNAIARPAGETTLRTAPGAFTGFDLDRLVLRSAAGGAADPGTGPLVAPASIASRPTVHVDHQSRTSLDLTVPSASSRFWLVLGQSYNLGWHATADGKDLGAPTLVDGFANGWQVPAGRSIHVHLEWTPQKVVWGALSASLAAVILTLGLILWPRRRAAETGEVLVALDRRPSMPRAFTWDRVLRYEGPLPSLFALVATTIGAAVLGWAVIGVIPGVVLAVAAAVTLRVRRARPVLTLGGLAVFAASALWMVVRQHVHDFPAGFEWPTYFEGVQQAAWTAIALLALDVVVDRCWLRRWWPTEDPPA